jgi:BirA family transcriptional regulator, biotin operon repressor / biotin---[acetyl-CoA-carboxylase] ligase
LLQHLVELDEVGSTNGWLLDQAEELPAGCWVVARSQTGGRGRRGRAWRSPPGNLYASTLVKLLPTDSPATQAPFVAAMALAEAVAAWAPAPRLQLKWPNDLLLDGRKLAGILIERCGDAMVIGFGVNLASHPDDVERPATSLAGAGLACPEPRRLLESLACSLAAWLDRWREQGFDRVRSAWLHRAHGPGTPLVARLADGSEVAGDFAALAGDGGLLLDLADGTRRVIHTADVFAL